MTDDGKDEMPRKPIELTDEQRGEIETLAALLNQDQIAYLEYEYRRRLASLQAIDDIVESIIRALINTMPANVMPARRASSSNLPTPINTIWQVVCIKAKASIAQMAKRMRGETISLWFRIMANTFSPNNAMATMPESIGNNPTKTTLAVILASLAASLLCTARVW